MSIKSLKLLLLLKPNSSKKKLHLHNMGLFLILQGRRTPQLCGLGIIVIPETEKPCLETTVCWTELLRMGDAGPLLGELNVRSRYKCFKNRKQKYGQLFLANKKASKRLCRTY